MNDEKRIAQKIAEIAPFAEHYPGAVIVLTGDARRVLYMSGNGLRLLDVSMAELTALGDDYHQRFFNPADAAEYVPKIVNLLARNDPQHTITFFQQVRTGPDAAYEWYLSTVRLLAQDAAGQPLLVISFACRLDPDSHMLAKVQRLADENTFLRTHIHTFACLGAREREVLRGLALGQSSHEIAESLCISPQTADTHRRNIRRKLNTTSAYDLGQYARAFNLI